MKLVFKIAFRYFFSLKRKTITNIIGLISILSTTFLALFLVVVLSAFNGLDQLVKEIFRTFDAEIEITATKGKSFEINQELITSIKSVEGVDIISQIIEDDGVIKYQDRSVVVKFKGVDSNYFRQNDLSNSIVRGKMKLLEDSSYYTLIGQGVEYKLSVPLNNQFTPLVLWYVRHTKNPRKAPFPSPIKAGGVFAIEKQFDDQYIFVPLEMAMKLTELGNRRTAIELNVKDGFEIDEVISSLRVTLGEDFEVLNSDEQHSGLYKAHQVEKLITFIIMVFLLFVGSLTIFFTLSMQVIEKQKDISVLFSLGFSRSNIRNVFLLNGMLISVMGTILGLCLAYIIITLQQNYGIIPMGMETSVVDNFPVEMRAIDFVLTGIALITVSLSISYYPAKKASDIIISDNI